MEQLRPYALCVESQGKRLVPIVTGHCNDIGLYRMVMQLSDIRQLFPQLLLVVNGYIVSRVEFTREGMKLLGQPAQELGYAD